MTVRNGLLSVVLTLIVAALPASPALARGDGDRLPAKWEKRHRLSLERDDARRDPDKDGLSNFGEYRAHTNPRKKDSDRDGRRDGREDYDRDRLRNAAEIRTGNDPGDADTDDDGVKDGREHAGRISALGGGSITIALAAGGSLTAKLGEDLWVECKSEDDEPHHEGGEKPEPAEHPGDDDDLGAGSSDDGDEESEAADDDEAQEADASTNDEEDLDSEEAAFDGAFNAEGGCGASQLKVGAVVHEALVKLTGDGPVLVAIELLAGER
jgi:hypothetical protein